MSSREKYEEEAARLARLPRAERFEALIEFPTAHMFKVIGRAAGFVEAIEQTLIAAGHPGVALMHRPSSQGKFLSLTFTLQVASGAELDQLYTLLEGVSGLAYIL